MLEMLLEKELLCNFFEIVFWSWFIRLSTSCSNQEKHVVATKGKSSQNNLKCTWKGSELELLAPMASNKNKHESNKNLEAMSNAITTQLLKKTIGALVSTKMTPIPPLEMGSNMLVHEMPLDTLRTKA